MSGLIKKVIKSNNDRKVLLTKRIEKILNGKTLPFVKRRKWNKKHFADNGEIGSINGRNISVYR